MLKFSIIIPAYNEEKNVGRLLNYLLKQKISENFDLEDITVVASGCTDKTEEVVSNIIKRNKRIKLLTQDIRKGKASAINLFLKNVKSDIIIMESADTLPEKNAIDKLLKQFIDERIGMVTARPIPVNSGTNSIIYDIRHEISFKYPPIVGELVAFRNIIEKIPEKTGADEQSISAMIQQKGYKVKYVPAAVVYNKGPERIFELIKQRKRIFIAHLWIKENQNYIVPSLKLSLLFQAILKEIKDQNKIKTLMFLIFLEVFIRISAMIDFYLRKKDVYAWEIAKTTKRFD